MHNTMGMAVLDSVNDLDENLAGLDLAKLPVLLDILHELAASGQLHDHD